MSIIVQVQRQLCLLGKCVIWILAKIFKYVISIKTIIAPYVEYNPNI